MTTTDATELAAGLKTLIDASEDGNHDIAIRVLCAAIKAAGFKIEIDVDDDSPDDMNSDGSYWVVSTHRLLIGGNDMIEGAEVAEWTRCSRGHYGSQGQRQLADSWEVEEDTDGGDKLPEAVGVALDALGIEDAIPDVDEPAQPNEERHGEWAVLHKNDYAVSDGRDTWGVVARYATQSDAEIACEAKWRGFTAATTQGSYGPEWCVGHLVGGEWQPIESDEE